MGFISTKNNGTTALTSGSTSGLSYLRNLNDCQIVNPSANQNLTYNGTVWSNTDALLSALGDITITPPRNNQVLTYDSTTSKWINSSSSGGGSSTLSGCTEVSISSPSNDQILVFTTDSSLNKYNIRSNI